METAVQQPLILIIDDEADFREIFTAVLKTAGFRVESAEDGESGIRKAKKLKPNLILMDVKMPGISGTEAFMKLKSDPATAGLKVLFLTNFGDFRSDLQVIDDRWAKESGAVGYFKKTDNLDDLVVRIKQILAV